MPEGSAYPEEQRMHWLGSLTLELERLARAVHGLDNDGGGKAMLGLLHGQQVVAIKRGR